MLNMREHIDNLRKEAETSLRVLYALMQFRQSITCKECVEKINENAHFWLIYESSVRTNLFIGIRRLFENKTNTFNFQKFIESCIISIKAFSKAEVRERKIKSSANANEWIDNYMSGVCEPSENDFNSLSRLVKENSKKTHKGSGLTFQHNSVIILPLWRDPSESNMPVLCIMSPREVIGAKTSM